MSQLHDDPQKAKVAASILLTLPGAPYVYYGEELGMRGTKPDKFIREPFLWGDEKFTTAWMEPKFNLSDSIADAKTQNDDRGSLLNHYKKLIAYRNSSRPLTFGWVESLTDFPTSVVALERSFDSESVIIFHNISDKEVKLQLTEGLEEFRKVEFDSEGGVSLRENELILPAYATVILKQ